ncbi:hypothetical protein HYPGJ_31625 [Hyphomicrobium sp. GJ21]|uniref:hypothetical protein n=1 Tax=Hyphomicrobium sp. GJ21 TaxID=113574 RepID=UPI000622B73D|nr:hypothetical protein [Hyphomicrobium sp. GJ21]CEJ88145.1 hypothetical protein HYPGJ_31625 [Hyphomicrobium sp. GJ21]
MANPEVTRLTLDIDARAKNLKALHDGLVKHLLAIGGDKDTALYLISDAEEYGLERALGVLADQPAAFGLDAAPGPADTAKLTTALKAIESGTLELDKIIRQRDHLLAADNPKHPLTFHYLGRLFNFSSARGEVTYLDNGEKVKMKPVGLSSREKLLRDRDRDR